MSTQEAVVSQDQASAESAVVDETKPDAPGEQEQTEGSEKQPEAEKQPTETEQPAKKPRPWFRDVIDAKEEQNAGLRRRNEELERQIREIQTPEQREQERQRQPAQGDVVAAARKQWDMEQKIARWDGAGRRDFPDFGERCQELARMGGNRQDFVEAVVDMEDGHKIVAHLAERPEEAVRILHLPPSRMAMELGRLSAKGFEPQPAPKSAAPPPIKPLGGGGRADGDANLTDDQWYAKWQAEHGPKG